jgi:hypothetical protein
MRPGPRHAAFVALLVLPSFTACLPYTVGSSAQTVPANESTHTGTFYFVPNAVKSPDDSIGVPMAGMDYEWRHGIDARSDFGVRMLPGGATTSYKRRIGADTSHRAGARAFAIGAGIVNWGEHALIEGTLMASGREDAAFTPYGGVRVMQTIPITSGAVSDRPTIGVFGGLQIGNQSFSIRPELGVFYDHSALGLRKNEIIFVPAFTLMRERRRDYAHSDGTSRRPSSLPRLPGLPRL